MGIAVRNLYSGWFLNGNTKFCLGSEVCRTARFSSILPGIKSVLRFSTLGT